MTRDNQIKGKQAGNQNQARQKMEQADRASEAGQSGGQEPSRLGTSTGPVTGGKRSRISGGNEGGGGSARRSER